MMNEHDARALRDLVTAAVKEAVAAAAGSACADLKAAIRAELAPIREALAELEGLPGTIETLSNQYLQLTAAIEPLQPLRPLIEAHREELREHRIKLGYLEHLEPKVSRLNILVDKLIPSVERALDRLDHHDGMLGEIRDLNEKRESNRAVGDKT
jgi:hypothetical protein